MMKVATWLQAVTGDLCHVLSELAFNSVQQPQPPPPSPSFNSLAAGRAALKSTVAIIIISSTCRNNKQVIEFWLLSPVLTLPLCPTHFGVSLLEEQQLEIEVKGLRGYLLP